VRESASPNTVTLPALDSVGEAFGFDWAGSAQGFSGFDGYGPSFRVGVILGEENAWDFLTSNTTGLFDGVCEFQIPLVLS
jgi:hypothetical protein